MLQNSDLKFPLMVKPALGYGGEDIVSDITNLDQLMKIIDKMILNGDILIEE